MKTFQNDLLKIKNVLLLLCITVFIGSCVGIKQKGNSSGPSNKIYEAFYIGLDTVQYYIKPLPIEDIDFQLSKENTMDATVRIVDNTADNIRLTFTTYTKAPIEKDATLNIKGNNNVLTSDKLLVYFSEKSENLFKNRFEYTVPFEEFKISIKGDPIYFEFKTKKEVNSFSSSKKMTTTFEKLRDSFL